MDGAVACVRRTINVSSTVVLWRFAMLNVMDGLMDTLDASVKGWTAQQLEVLVRVGKGRGRSRGLYRVYQAFLGKCQ